MVEPRCGRFARGCAVYCGVGPGLSGLYRVRWFDETDLAAAFLLGEHGTGGVYWVNCRLVHPGLTADLVDLWALHQAQRERVLGALTADDIAQLVEAISRR